MTRLATALVFALLLCLVAPPADAQTGEDVLRFGQRDIGFTPRTVGLAGATAAGIADWGAAVTNPAALALARRAHVTGSLDVTTTGSETRTGIPRDARVTRFITGHGAYVVAIPTVRGAFNLGIGFHHVTSLDRRMFYVAEAGQEWADLFEHGWLSELSFAGAVEVAPRIYFGASLNVPIGDYAFTEFRGHTVEPTQSFFLESSLRGFNARAGVIAEVTDGLRLGLGLESPTWLHAQERFGPVQPAPERFNYTMQMPWRVSGGVAYEFDDILISVDMVLIDWSQARIRPGNNFVEENREIARDFRETLDVRIGAEYDFGVGAVRAGYAMNQDPLRHEIETARLRHTFASGLSFYVRPGLTLDVGLAHTDWRDQVFVGDTVVTESVGRFRALAGLHFIL